MGKSQTHRSSLLALGLDGLIRLYQWQAPFWGPHCRFYPSCSEYTRNALQTLGIWDALGQATCRILKCHPWHPGGVDLVKISHGK